MRCIVYTRPDGGVNVFHPDPFCLRGMCHGGAPIPRDVPMARHVENWISAGLSPDFARRWMRALWFGGCTEAEAFELIRQKDVPVDAGLPDVVDLAELPDRWFRNAWTRSHNGGPIVIDLNRAREVQARRISAAHADCLAQWHAGDWLRGDPPELHIGRLRDLIRQARDLVELRSIWPGHLARVT
jgi:hypothetical protein